MPSYPNIDFPPAPRFLGRIKPKRRYRGYGSNGRVYRIHRDAGTRQWWATLDPREEAAKVRHSDLAFAAQTLRDLSTKLEGLKP